MKKNFVPLVGIALAVAMVSTGLFYVTFGGKLRDAAVPAPGPPVIVAARTLERGAVLKPEDVKVVAWGAAEPKGAFASAGQINGMVVVDAIQEGEPVLAVRLASREKGLAGAGIPAGMRAISVHVTDSSGVVAMLRPGNRIDLQVIGNRGGEAELRTVLQNIEVLGSGQPDLAQGRSATPVINLLVSPAEAEAIGLADSAARIRIALRNPLDDARTSSPSLAMAHLFRETALRETVSRAANPAGRQSVQAAPDQVNGSVSLLVRMAAADPAAVDELKGRLVGGRSAGVLQVSAFRADADPEGLLRTLTEKRAIEMLSTTRVQAGGNRQASVQASARGDAASSLRIQFLPLPCRAGTVRLRVEPEAVWPGKNGPASRRVTTEIDVLEGRAFLVTGLLEAGRAAIETLFPGKLKNASSQELVVVVTPQRVSPVQTAGLHPAR